MREIPVIAVIMLSLIVFWSPLCRAEDAVSSRGDTPLLKSVMDREKVAEEERAGAGTQESREDALILDKERQRSQMIEEERVLEDREIAY